MSAYPLLDYIEQRDAAMAQVEQNAGDEFKDRAAAFIPDRLRRHGPTSGEELVNAAVGAGIVPHDARAFGPVFMRLIRGQVIERVGDCPRTKGHGTKGGSIYALKP